MSNRYDPSTKALNLSALQNDTGKVQLIDQMYTIKKLKAYAKCSFALVLLVYGATWMFLFPLSVCICYRLEPRRAVSYAEQVSGREGGVQRRGEKHSGGLLVSLSFSVLGYFVRNSNVSPRGRRLVFFVIFLLCVCVSGSWSVWI